MDNTAKRFVHVLLFECPRCGGPIATTKTTDERNLEEVDEGSFACQCFCGWNGTIGGLKARKHWVEPWAEHGGDAGS